MPADEYKFHLAATLRYLGIRARSRAEIERYLQVRLKGECSSNIAIQIIEYLDQHGFINDVDFATNWILAKINRGQGYRQIQQSLLLRGLDRDLINQSLSQIDSDIWIEAAISLLEKKGERWSQFPIRQQHAKAYSFLTNRGFLQSHCRAAIDRWGGNRVK
jgi:regulatory protein